MSEHDHAPHVASADDEGEVRRLLAQAGGGGRPTSAERHRMAEAMWAAADDRAPSPAPELEAQPHDLVDQSRSSHRRPRTPGVGGRATRVALWAAMILVAVGAVAMVGTSPPSTLTPTTPASDNRTSVRVGDTEVSFDPLVGYTLERHGPALITLTDNGSSLRTHSLITVAQVEELFGGQAPEAFLVDAGLDPERQPTDAGSEAWLVAIDPTADCSHGQSCVTIGALPGGQPLELRAGSFTRIEVHDNGDRHPIVVLAEVGSPSSGPALWGMELGP